MGGIIENYLVSKQGNRTIFKKIGERKPATMEEKIESEVLTKPIFHMTSPRVFHDKIMNRLIYT